MDRIRYQLANPKTIDVAIPDEYRSRWTVDLIGHLFRSKDELLAFVPPVATSGSPESATPSRRTWPPVSARRSLFGSWAAGTKPWCARRVILG